jgi:N-carbamoylputrescine amidase
MKRKIAMGQISAEGSRDDTLSKAEGMIEEAASKKAELICFPEVGFDKFFPRERTNEERFDLAEPIPGPITERLKKKAKDHKIVVIASLLEEARPGEYYDSAVCIDADGTILGITRMTHIYEGLNYNEKYYYSPGNTYHPVYKTKAGPVGIAICYDGWFPEVMRVLTMRGAELIVVPTAEMCEPDEYDWWVETFTTAQGKAPAIYNNVFIGCANRVGIEENVQFIGSSYVVDPWGKILERASKDNEEVLIAEINTDEIRQTRKCWPFLRDRRPDTYGILNDQWGSKVKYDRDRVEID